MTPPYRLHYAPDNASLIVRLALEELGQPYETRLVDRAAQGQRAPAYLALNPNGLIPVLETSDGPIFETAAILLWLAERHGALAPHPGDTRRAAFLKWLIFTANTLHPGLRMLFYPHSYVGQDARAQAHLRKTMTQELDRHLRKLDDVAAERPAWLGGAQPSALDLYLAPCLRWCALYPAGMTGWFALARYPALQTLCARLEGRASTRAAILAEGLGPHPFTAPIHPAPPEGSAT
ncbi:MAG: glutathione S-transferase family protein [Paracoccaceae bacterium]